MGKKIVSVDKYFMQRRSEIIRKFSVDEDIKKQVNETELMFLIKMIEDKNKEIAKRKPVKKAVKKATLSDRRSEIVGKFTKVKSSDLNKTRDKKKSLEVDKNKEEFKDFSLDNVEKYLTEKRSEVINKVDLKVGICKKVKEKDLKVIIETIAEKNEEILKRKSVEKIVKKATLEDKRSEIVDKVILNSFDGNKVVKDGLDEEPIKSIDAMRLEEINEQKLEELEDEVQENVEKISIAMVLLVVLICAIVGIGIGYMLYKIAMNNSNVVGMIFRYFI